MRILTCALGCSLALCLFGPLDPVAAQTTHDVDVGPGFSFLPADLTVQVGDTVRWTWIGGNHNVESGTGGVHDGAFRSGDPTLMAGTVFEFIFDQAFLDAFPMAGNVYPYYCAVHVAVGMTGTITVEGGGGGDSDFVRGRCNGDATSDIADAVFLLAFLFSGGPLGDCADACDMNDDGALDVSDPIYFLGALFSGGPPPPDPNPDCGPDTTDDALDCASFAGC